MVVRARQVDLTKTGAAQDMLDVARKASQEQRVPADRVILKDYGDYYQIDMGTTNMPDNLVTIILKPYAVGMFNSYGCDLVDDWDHYAKIDQLHMAYHHLNKWEELVRKGMTREQHNVNDIFRKVDSLTDPKDVVTVINYASNRLTNILDK